VKRYIAVVAVLMMALVTPGRAQEQRPAPPATTWTSIRVQVVLSRFQGEKKISSLPYTLTVNSDSRSGRGIASLRLGTQVPITTMSRPGGGDDKAALVPTVQYRDVGTNVDCYVTALDDGRFRLDLTVEDSSVEAGTATSAHPTFKSFRTSDQLLLRDGQSAQYSTATDKINGDVWKVDVTLTVVK